MVVAGSDDQEEQAAPAAQKGKRKYKGSDLEDVFKRYYPNGSNFPFQLHAFSKRCRG